MDKKTGGRDRPIVGIIMGSDSDWKTMGSAADVLKEFDVPFDPRVVSAHRTPNELFTYANEAEDKGLLLIIAGAGGAAHLPGMTASKTHVPVVGVPVVATPLGGIDALLSIAQMPAEVGVATVGIGGAKHAALFALRALAVRIPSLREKLRKLHGASPAAVGAPEKQARVAILAENQADLDALSHTQTHLHDLGVEFDAVVASKGIAKQTSDLESRGARVFIVATRAEMAFTRAVAKSTAWPVLNVPLFGRQNVPLDDFVRLFQDMPPGLATFAIDKPGAINTALFAATLISAPQSKTWKTLRQMRLDQVKRVQKMKVPPL